MAANGSGNGQIETEITRDTVTLSEITVARRALRHADRLLSRLEDTLAADAVDRLTRSPVDRALDPLDELG